MDVSVPAYRFHSNTSGRFIASLCSNLLNSISGYEYPPTLKKLDTGNLN